MGRKHRFFGRTLVSISLAGIAALSALSANALVADHGGSGGGVSWHVSSSQENVLSEQRPGAVKFAEVDQALNYEGPRWYAFLLNNQSPGVDHPASTGQPQVNASVVRADIDGSGVIQGEDQKPFPGALFATLLALIGVVTVARRGMSK